MELCASLSDPPIAALILASASKNVSVKWCQENCLSVKGVKFETPSALARYLAHDDKKNSWYGSNPLEEAEVNHWVSYAVSDLWLNDINSSQMALPYLDKSLAPATFLVGNQCSLADIVVWAKLFCSGEWQSLVTSKTTPKNVKRWYDFIFSIDFVAEAIRKLPENVQVAQKEEPQSSGRKEEGKFVDLPGAEMGKVVVRFPPEASGYLHIGHAKAALLNQYYQQTFNGKLIMRFDDTNPAKEKVDFEKVILEDVELLQVKYDIFSHTSNYFELMLEMCEKLLKEGKAYADDTDPETMKSEREQRVASKNRSNAVEKNFKLWEEMKRGTDYGQKCCIRAKIDMNSANGCMRDPTIYRCKNEPHPRTGEKYKVYPTYDFACPIVDSIEGVTHCLRTTEYADRDEQFYWFIEAMGLRKPYVWAYSRLNMTNTVLSKRKLTWFVENGLVDGWDDPRMPTVRGVLRRGMTVEGLRQFIIAQGSSRSVVVMEWDKIWAINKKVIDPVAPRYTAVESKYVTVTIAGVTESAMKAAKHPKNPDVGDKTVWTSPKVLIDEADAVLLKEGEDVTFINWGNITIKKIERSGDKITGISALPNLDNKNYKKTLKITWLADTPKAPLIPCLCVYLDHIISKPILGKDEDFKQYIGHNTKTEIEMLGDPELANVKKSDIIQLQRKGFFICDRPYSSSSIHTGLPTPIVLFFVPDGHTKETVANAPKSALPANSVEPKQTNGQQVNASNIAVLVQSQGDLVRQLKTSKASKEQINEAVQQLLSLKQQYKNLTGQDYPKDGKPPMVQAPNASSPLPSNDVVELCDQITAQGNIVRDLKASKADKNKIGAAVEDLLRLKQKYKDLSGKDWTPSAPTAKLVSPSSLSDQITAQGDKVRDLKSNKADKKTIDAEVKVLLNLKEQYKEAFGKDWTPSPAKTKTDQPTTADVERLSDEIALQGNKVRDLKASKADKNKIDAEVKKLLTLKQQYKEAFGKDWTPSPAPTKTDQPTTADVEVMSNEITAQGNKVRDLKASKADKNKIDAEVKMLLSLKQKYKEISGKDWAPSSNQPPPAQGNQSNLEANIKTQGDLVRTLKSDNSPKEEVDKAVQKLLALKEEFKKVTGKDYPKESSPRDSKSSKSKNPKPAPKPEPKKETDTAVKKVTRLGLEATKEDNLPDWYSQVIVKGELIEYYDVSGCYILRPWSFSIWEILRDWFDKEIKKLGVKNCYFPIFVSKAVLEKEKTHVADFAPEVAWVTKSGDSDLAEHIAIRPTSETVMYPAYAKWIQSYRDLPIKLNQWNNVVRWEFKHPQPFLRTREFLWQEGHTAFSSYKEAEEEVYTILGLYEKVYTELLAIPVVKGRKTEKEKFAGGDYTLTVEALISASGRAIQGATSHHLGQNFSKMFEIIYEDPETQEKKFVFQNSWGMTTRTIGVMVMVHADNQGLVLPPRVASVQVIIVPCGITASLADSEKTKLVDLCNTIKADLVNSGIRAETDLRENYSPGWKFNHWELKGVPIRVEVGPKDMQKDQIVAVRRDTGAKLTFPLKTAVQDTMSLLDEIHNEMLSKATKDLNDHMVICRQWSDFTRHLDNKNIIQAPFCGRIECEDKIKEDSARTQPDNSDVNAPSMGAKSLCIPLSPLDLIQDTDKCIHPSCSTVPKFFTLFGRSY